MIFVMDNMTLLSMEAFVV